MLNGFHAQIHIQIRPMETAWSRLLNSEDLANRSLLEPGEILKREKKFPLTDEKPYPMSRYIRYLNLPK